MARNEGWAQAPNIIEPLAHAMRDSGVQAFGLSASQQRFGSGGRWLSSLGWAHHAGDFLVHHAIALGLHVIEFNYITGGFTANTFHDPRLRSLELV